MLEIAINKRMKPSNCPFLMLSAIKILKQLSGEKSHIDLP